MLGGGDYAEVERWVRNFVVSHAKREDVRVEAIIDAAGSREGQSYGIRLVLGNRMAPPPALPPIEISFAEAARERGSLAWCQGWAERIRALARELPAGAGEVRHPV